MKTEDGEGRKVEIEKGKGGKQPRTGGFAYDVYAGARAEC